MKLEDIVSHLLLNTPNSSKIPRLEFFEYLERIYGYNLEKLNFYWEQSGKYEEEFYKLVFEKFLSQAEKDDLEKAKLDRILKEVGFSNIDKNIFDYQKLSEQFLQIEKNKTEVGSGESQNKGKQFEIFLKDLFNAIEGLEISEINQAEDEQIDLVIKNNVDKPFWINLRSPVIIGEAKNWSSKTNTEVLNTLRGKGLGHTNFSRIGIVIAMNGFTKTVDTNLLRDGSGDRIIVAITGDDIKSLLNDKLNPLEWLEGIIMKSFV